jgi:hypothetical protein
MVRYTQGGFEIFCLVLACYISVGPLFFFGFIFFLSSPPPHLLSAFHLVAILGLIAVGSTWRKLLTAYTVLLVLLVLFQLTLTIGLLFFESKTLNLIHDMDNDASNYERVEELVQGLHDHAIAAQIVVATVFGFEVTVFLPLLLLF